MCLSIPYQIKSISHQQATVSCSVCHDESKTVGLDLVPRLKKGDYVLVQNNLAVRKVPKREAEEILKLIIKHRQRTDCARITRR